MQGKQDAVAVVCMRSTACVLQILLWSRVSESTLALAVSSPKIYEVQVVKANFKIICNPQFSGVESPELRVCLQTGCENVQAGAGEPPGLGAPAARPVGKGPEEGQAAAGTAL